MFSLANVRLSQRMYFLVVLLVFGFLTIGVTYFVQISVEKGIRQETSAFEESDRFLGQVRFDLLNLNRLLLERFSLKQESTTEKLFQLRASLSGSLMSLLGRTQGVDVAAGLKSIENQLREFDTVNQQLLIEEGILGENAKNGLLLELALVAEQFETVLVDINSTTIKLAVLDIRSDEKSLINNPNAQVLSQLDEKIYALTDLLAKVKQPKEEADFILSVVEDYSTKLSHIVATGERVSALQVELMTISDNLMSATAELQVIAKQYSDVQFYAYEQKSSFLFKLFMFISFAVLVVTLGTVISILKIVRVRLATLTQGVARLSEGKLDTRVYISAQDEFGVIAKSLNVFLNGHVRELQEKSEELDTQNHDIDLLVGALKSMADQQMLDRLAVIEGRVGTLATAVNHLNGETYRTLMEMKKSSVEVELAADKIQTHSCVIEQTAEDSLKQVMGTTKALQVLTKAISDLAVKAQRVATTLKESGLQDLAGKEAAVALENGMLPIKESITIVEKRMDGLLNLSREIQEIVNIINSIADRAHISALNASMCNKSSDSLPLVDDMQELAQHARAGGRKVVLLVESTCNETFEVINAMNRLIEDVVAGMQLAEYAGERLILADSVTAQLSMDMGGIAEGAAKQAALMSKLSERSNAIRKYTEKNIHELKSQKCSIDNLKSHSELFRPHAHVLQLPEQWLGLGDDTYLRENMVVPADETLLLSEKTHLKGVFEEENDLGNTALSPRVKRGFEESMDEESEEQVV